MRGQTRKEVVMRELGSQRVGEPGRNRGPGRGVACSQWTEQPGSEAPGAVVAAWLPGEPSASQPTRQFCTDQM